MVIALEGIDGVGKTTTCKLLHKLVYQKTGGVVEVVHDPDENDSIGEFVNKKWKNKEKYNVDIWPLLFAASSINSQSSINGYLTNKNNNKIIILDRCALSTYAYFLDKCDSNWIDSLHRKYIFPDLTIIINLDSHTILDRLQNRGNEERFNLQYINRLKKLYYEAYLYLLKKNIKMEYLDVLKSDSPDIVVNKIYKIIKKYSILL